MIDASSAYLGTPGTLAHLSSPSMPPKKWKTYNQTMPLKMLVCKSIDDKDLHFSIANFIHCNGLLFVVASCSLFQDFIQKPRASSSGYKSPSQKMNCWMLVMQYTWSRQLVNILFCFVLFFAKISHIFYFFYRIDLEPSRQFWQYNVWWWDDCQEYAINEHNLCRCP